MNVVSLSAEATNQATAGPASGVLCCILPELQTGKLERRMVMEQATSLYQKETTSLCENIVEIDERMMQIPVLILLSVFLSRMEGQERFR